MGIFPILDQVFTLDREHRRALRRDGGSRVVLGREDVARGPAHVGTQRLQGLDQHGGLDGHVQGASDAGALERLGFAKLGARGHQARHLGFSNIDFLATEIGQRNVSYHIVGHSLS